MSLNDTDSSQNVLRYVRFINSEIYFDNGVLTEIEMYTTAEGNLQLYVIYIFYLMN